MANTRPTYISPQPPQPPLVQPPPGFGPNPPSGCLYPGGTTIITHRHIPCFHLPYYYESTMRPAAVDPPTAIKKPKVSVPTAHYLNYWRLTGRPWTDSTVQPSDAEFATSVTKQDGRFLMQIDLQSADPATDAMVTVRNGYLVVEARHDEQQDATGIVSRKFCRRYKLDGVEPASTKCFTTNGILKITGVLKPPSVKPDARQVPILLTEAVVQE